MNTGDPHGEAVAASSKWQSSSAGRDSSHKRIDEIYASDVFDERKMRERLPKNTFKAVCKTIESKGKLSTSDADVIATAMKDWAIERGATHYTHWFQPMTGLTAEKHDSLIMPDGDGGVVFCCFQGVPVICVPSGDHIAVVCGEPTEIEQDLRSVHARDHLRWRGVGRHIHLL